jgi:serine protein kinase
MFALLTRLKPSKKQGLTLMAKLKLYDGEKQVGDWDQKHLRELQEEHQDEGMHGVSPRFVMNRLSSALVRGNKSCITPIDVLRAMRDGLQDISSNEEEYRRYLGYLDETRKDYDEIAKKRCSARSSTPTNNPRKPCSITTSTTSTRSATAPRSRTRSPRTTWTRTSG